MSTKASYRIAGLLIFISIGIVFFCYPLLPEKMVSHWGASGEPDGHIGKLWGALLLPLLMLFLSVLLFSLPVIDPLKKNITAFRREYNLLIVSVLLFLFFVNALTLIWNLGTFIDIGRWIGFGIGALFVVTGYVLPLTKRNWFLGIRTPWTLSSDSVWKKTHDVGSILFYAGGVLVAISGLFFPRQAFVSIIATVCVAGFGSMLYSYILYRREQNA